MPSFILRPDGLPPVNGFSHVTIAAGTVIHISGQVPARSDGSAVAPGDVAAQCEQVFTNVAIALAAAGATWSDVVKLTYYLTDINDLAEVRAVRDRHLDAGRLPASSLVQVAALVHPDFKIEIDAVAVV